MPNVIAIKDLQYLGNFDYIMHPAVKSFLNESEFSSFQFGFLDGCRAVNNPLSSSTIVKCTIFRDEFVVSKSHVDLNGLVPIGKLHDCSASHAHLALNLSKMWNDVFFACGSGDVSCSQYYNYIDCNKYGNGAIDFGINGDFYRMRYSVFKEGMAYGNPDDNLPVISEAEKVLGDNVCVGIGKIPTRDHTKMPVCNSPQLTLHGYIVSDVWTKMHELMLYDEDHKLSEHRSSKLKAQKALKDSENNNDHFDIYHHLAPLFLGDNF